jgi:hypothetical protein
MKKIEIMYKGEKCIAVVNEKSLNNEILIMDISGYPLEKATLSISGIDSDEIAIKNNELLNELIKSGIVVEPHREIKIGNSQLPLVKMNFKT